MKTPRSKTLKPAAAQVLPFPVIADKAALNTLRASTNLFSRTWSWVQQRQAARLDVKRLRVAETVSLGEKRFVAVVQVDGRHFLLAGGPTNIVLLAQLDPKDDFEKVLQQTMIPPARRLAKRAKKKKPVPAKNAKAMPPKTKEKFTDVLEQTVNDSWTPSDKLSIRQTGNA